MVMAMGVESDMVASDAIWSFVCGVYCAGGSQMRDSKRLQEIRKMPCCECGADPPSQAAHSNFSIHGKGRGIKASDEYVIPLCHKHHHQFDAYSMGMDREQSIEWFLSKLDFINGVPNGKDNQADF